MHRSRLISWLYAVPVERAYSRHNAAMLQALLGVATAVVVGVVISGWREDGRLPSGGVAQLAIGACLVTCFFLVRRGWLRLPAYITVGLSLVLIGLSYQHYGFMAHTPLLIVHLLPLMFAAVLLGRRGLWQCLLALAVILGLGAWVDMNIYGAEHDALFSSYLQSIFSFLVIAFILDRLLALMQSIAHRNAELGLAYLRLQKETEEKEKSQAQLLQFQKIEAIGSVASAMAHDFNNVLAVIHGHASNLTPSVDATSVTQSLASIKAAAERGGAITRRLLDLSRSDHHAPVALDVAAAISDMRPLLEPLLGGRVLLSTHCGDEPAMVRMDIEELELALLNIATNSRDAMPDGGIFRVAVCSDARRVYVYLEDNGVGMSPKTAERIFEPFFTTKPKGKGSGIGLAVVHRVVIEAGGAIEIRTAPNAGLLIKMSLPRLDIESTSSG